MPRHTASQLEDARSPSPTATTSFLAAPSRRSSTVEVEGREVVYWDEEITVYRAAGKERLCSDGRHLIVAMNRHVEGVYDLVSCRSCSVSSRADCPLSEEDVG